ncbi:MAG: site-specific integrase [Thermoguttaceae bacterium]|nr:site-specific integrase [Thermoguttaceae bacterium]MDW8039126.1 hypothetical protein [Thermoguttaceae bacterium]
MSLTHYGELRSPLKPFRLRWQDANWENPLLRVPSPKTETKGKPFRVIPINKALMPYLEEVWELAPEVAE